MQRGYGLGMMESMLKGQGGLGLGQRRHGLGMSDLD